MKTSPNVFISDREAIATRKISMFGPPVRATEIAVATELYYYPGTRYYFQPNPLFRGRWITALESITDPISAGGATGTGFAYFNQVALITFKNYKGETLLYNFPWYEISFFFAAGTYPYVIPPFDASYGDAHYKRKFNLYDVCMEQSYFVVTQTVLQTTTGFPGDTPAFSWNLTLEYTDVQPYVQKHNQHGGKIEH